jgi:peptidoglycan/LPS O-acetylase OafA/YrhL
MADVPAVTSSEVFPGRLDLARKSKPTRLRELDGLRGIAILLVTMKHLAINAIFFTQATHAGISVPMRYERRIFDAGWMGVDLFFVLSGFLITGILVDTAGHVHYYRNFIVRRALRIFPLYYAFLFIVLISSPSMSRNDVPWFLAYLGNVHLFLINSWLPLAVLGPLWSLQIEEQFYLAFPWIVLKTSRETLTRVLIGAVVAALLIRIAFQLAMPDNDFATYTLTPSRMDTLALGGLIAIALRQNPEILKHRLIPRLTIVCALGFTAAWETRRVAIINTIGYSFLELTFAGVLILVITNAVPRLTAICRFKPLVGLGVISYSLYMLEMPVFLGINRVCAALGRIRGGDFDEMLICLAAAILAATLSWRFFESPFLKLKDRFTVPGSPSSPRAFSSAVPADS